MRRRGNTPLRRRSRQFVIIWGCKKGRGSCPATTHNCTLPLLQLPGWFQCPFIGRRFSLSLFLGVPLISAQDLLLRRSTAARGGPLPPALRTVSADGSCRPTISPIHSQFYYVPLALTSQAHIGQSTSVEGDASS